ncbi:MAG: PIN domain-containing protein [Candidatus Margulisbacteria bacterium]|jgi:predicted nucleic acid-binding protein|nr:PIN domain-containing protein [Candidatus Margulisiibacteriota bacterium]
MRIYLDICCFNRPYDDQEQLKIKLETEAKLFIQQEILSGKHELIWSYILEYENNRNPYEEKRNAIKLWKDVAKIHCEENSEIIKQAEKLEKQGLKTKDALHVACAINALAKYFITTDKQLLSAKIKDIRIINPVDFIDILEE